MGASRHVLRFAATRQAFEDATGTLHRLLDASQIKGPPRLNVELAFEEIATNIVRHGAPTEDILVTIVFDRQEVLLTFEDDGIPFDPRERPTPVRPSSIADAKIGGLGITLVKKFSTRLDYERTAQHRNRLTVAIAT